MSLIMGQIELEHPGTTDMLKNQGLFGKGLRKYLSFYRDVLRKDLQQGKNEVFIFSGEHVGLITGWL